jgi:hypothetical protein
MHDTIAAAIAAAATVPDMTVDTARFADGTVVTRHVIRHPGDPAATDDDEPIRPFTQTLFEITTPDGHLFLTTSRMIIDLEA